MLLLRAVKLPLGDFLKIIIIIIILMLEIINIVTTCYLGNLHHLLSFLIRVIWSSKLCLFFTSVHTPLAERKKS